MSKWESILEGLARAGEAEQLNKSFGQDWYTVREAHRELTGRGMTMNLETLRRSIRRDEVKVKKLSERKTLIHKNELIRLLRSHT